MKTIKLAGYEWQVLNEETGLICTKDIVHNMQFGANNKWSTSDVRKWLNKEFINTFTEEELGYINGEIRLLEESEINEISEDERVKGNSYWLKTPYSSYSHNVRCVHPAGTVYYYCAYDGNLGVVPALNLKSGILESFFLKEKSEIEKIREEIEKLSERLKKLESEGE